MQSPNSVAPYNFVGFSEFVFDRYLEAGAIPSFDKFTEGTLSGEIEYTAEAISPVLIGKGRSEKGVEPYRAPDGWFAIPGTSMRGLVRSHAQILGFSDIRDEVEDRRFVFRSVADLDPVLRKYYIEYLGIHQAEKGKPSVSEHLRSGYLECTGKDAFVIRPARSIEGRSFLRVGEYGLQTGRTRMDGPLQLLYQRFDRYDPKDGTASLERWKAFKSIYSNRNRDFHPHMHQVHYAYSIGSDGSPHVHEVSTTGKPLEHKGYWLSSGFMTKKSSHYIIPEADSGAEAIEVPIQDVRDYRWDFDRRKQILKPNADFYKLPAPGETKPVFYVYREGRLSFGFTPNLRIFYLNSVSVGIPPSHNGKHFGRDYASAMFGGVREQSSLKGRVSFMDARSDDARISPVPAKVILAEPKPTCFPDYLKQSGVERLDDLNTYNKDKFRLRGSKFYWMKEGLVRQGDLLVAQGKEDGGTVSTLHTLEPGAHFRGRIHFRNLHPDELGLLLWSLKPHSEGLFNIGMGKPYGYGRLRLTDVHLSIRKPESAYRRIDTTGLEAVSDSETLGFVEKYKTYIRSNSPSDGKCDPNKERSVKDLLLIRSLILPQDKSRYMVIEGVSNNEFKRRYVLPTIREMDEKMTKGV